MFETAINAAYLAKHPTDVRDYLDYHWIRQRRLLDYMRKEDATNFQLLKQSYIDDIDREYAKVVPTFTDSRQKVRNDWCTKNLRQRAECIGMGQLYPTFYGYVSSIHHGDIAGLASQITTAKFQTEVVRHPTPSRMPSLWVTTPSSPSSATSMRWRISVWTLRSRRLPISS